MIGADGTVVSRGSELAYVYGSHPSTLLQSRRDAATFESLHVNGVRFNHARSQDIFWERGGGKREGYYLLFERSFCDLSRELGS